MDEYKVDLIVIGSGPAGQKAAIQGAKLGKKVLVIEQDPMPGGACLYTGTIPSKTLREAIVDLTGFYQKSYYGRDFKIREHEVTIPELNYRVSKVIEEERNIINRQFRKNHIEVLEGSAHFVNPHTLELVSQITQQHSRVIGDFIIISTGSKPRNPVDISFDDEVILDSTRLLKISRVPKSMLVLGGGIIGSEYASFFAALGTEVTVIDRKEHMLPMLDSEIGMHLQTALTNIGLKFMGRKEPLEIKRVGDRAFVRFKDNTTAEADVLLYALGRIANVDSLCIENAGISLNAKGYIPVNALFQTSVPHIYAAGDVIGGPSLASTSMEQGRLAAREPFGAKTHHFPAVYPIGIYTIPEISSCGYTEDELKDRNYHYEIGRAYYYEIARSHITGNDVGLFKLIFHAETMEILGVHVIGRGATEVIHIGQVAMSFNARVDYFIDQIFNYPTYAEGYRIAALNGSNKVKTKG